MSLPEWITPKTKQSLMQLIETPEINIEEFADKTLNEINRNKNYSERERRILELFFDYAMQARNNSALREKYLLN